MKKIALLCASLCAMVLLISASPVQAQTLVWVSPNGNDSNACTQTAPCATFSGAISKGSVAQINCLGSGNYGSLNGTTTVSITDSIVIDCGEGNVGEMTTGGGSAAININSSNANAVIVLRHLSLNGGGNDANGIDTQGFPGGSLIVENCMIHGFHFNSGSNGNGIKFVPTSGRGLLQVSDSVLYDNNYNSLVVNANGSSVIASVVLNRDEFTANPLSGAYGIWFTGSGTVAGSMRQSLVAENGGNGFFAHAGQVYFTIEESSFIDNVGTGIATDSSGAHINVGASTIGGNGIGVATANGASLVSFGNNQMSANGVNGTFTSTTPLQ